MDTGNERMLQSARSDLQASRKELEELQREIGAFETLVDQRLGILLDQISSLTLEITSLNETMLQIREQRLFGRDRMRSLGATPAPARAPDWDLPQPVGAPFSEANINAPEIATASHAAALPDIKELYRMLARRYHPDMARTEAERTALNEQMAEINLNYADGNLAKLMMLAGMEVPFDLEIAQLFRTPELSRAKAPSELERVQADLARVRQQITRLSNLPSVQLSLDVKLARRQGRDLLGEMAADLQHKVKRKIAERDYLQSQIKLSGLTEDS